MSDAARKPIWEEAALAQDLSWFQMLELMSSWCLLRGQHWLNYIIIKSGSSDIFWIKGSQWRKTKLYHFHQHIYAISHSRFFIFSITLRPFPMHRLLQGEHTPDRECSCCSQPFLSKKNYWSLEIEFWGHHTFETGTECKGWYVQTKVLLAEGSDEAPAKLIQSGKPKDHHLKIIWL